MNHNDLPHDDMLQLILGELDDARRADVQKAMVQDAELAVVAQELTTAVAAVRAENAGQPSRRLQRSSPAADGGGPRTGAGGNDTPTVLSRSLTTWRWIMRSRCLALRRRPFSFSPLEESPCGSTRGGTTCALPTSSSRSWSKDGQFKMTTEERDHTGNGQDDDGYLWSCEKGTLAIRISGEVMRLDADRRRMEVECRIIPRG